ncbi:AaceriABL010Wp [[Ashbya] aceris (nom. inval.)]|nr:AaceriABL010Wp [[Ashbya] aceris (nom. inval.)]
MPHPAEDEVPDRVIFERGGRTLEVHGARFMRPHTVVKPWEQRSHAPAEDTTTSLLQAGGHRPEPSGTEVSAGRKGTGSEKKSIGGEGHGGGDEKHEGGVSPPAAHGRRAAGPGEQ